MGIADRRRAKTLEATTPLLRPGEQVRAMLPFAQTGPVPWFFAITYLILFFIKYYAIVATDQRVLFLKRGKLAGKVHSTIVEEHPLGQVTVAEWKANPVWSRLMLARPDGVMKLNVHRVHRSDAEEFIAALTPSPQSESGSWTPPSGV
jgi:hypothetical protein